MKALTKLIPAFVLCLSVGCSTSSSPDDPKPNVNPDSTLASPGVGSAFLYRVTLLDSTGSALPDSPAYYITDTVLATNLVQFGRSRVTQHKVTDTGFFTLDYTVPQFVSYDTSGDLRYYVDRGITNDTAVWVTIPLASKGQWRGPAGWPNQSITYTYAGTSNFVVGTKTLKAYKFDYAYGPTPGGDPYVEATLLYDRGTGVLLEWLEPDWIKYQLIEFNPK